MCDELASELTALLDGQRNSSKTRIGGVRNILRQSRQVTAFANSIPREHIENLFGRSAFPVRAIFFDKTAESNWRVPWHQDLTIAVAARIETEGFGPWSVKEGVVHVQPPTEVLANMATLRLHLDNCGADNGPLRLIPGSHQHGELSADAINNLVASACAVTCEIPKGGALMMRPLLLHASSPARLPSHRRVLHLEYACEELPNGLNWFDR